MVSPDVLICGGGIIGLSLALELKLLGQNVLVLESSTAARQASSAAAGMLAASDPENPLKLRPLADLSLSLYPAFLHRVRSLCQHAIPLQTRCSLQKQSASFESSQAAPLRHFLPSAISSAPAFVQLQEDSLDPRQLAAALPVAARNAGVKLLEQTPVLSIDCSGQTIQVRTQHTNYTPHTVVVCTGAWARSLASIPIAPVKGQMLRIQPPSGSLHSPQHGNLVVRTPEFYIVPRLDGTALIGATVEDLGFDTTIHPEALSHLQQQAATLIPSLATSPVLESWAGLRPGTPDHLPVIGQLRDRLFLATGHLRNGILLAPATAHLAARLLARETSPIDLVPFSPNRFAPAP